MTIEPQSANGSGLSERIPFALWKERQELGLDILQAAEVAHVDTRD